MLYLMAVVAIGPFLDHPPLDINALLYGSLREKLDTLPSLRTLMKTGKYFHTLSYADFDYQTFF